MQRVRLEMWVSGKVQMVGFRLWTRDQARELDLVGSATNLPDGRVAVVVEGLREDCQALLDAVWIVAPGRVTGIEHSWHEARGDCADFQMY